VPALFDQGRLGQKRLEALLKLRAECSEVNTIWTNYWGNKKGLLQMTEFQEAQKSLNSEMNKYFSQQEKY
jgi:hypothetical protein